MNYTPAAPYWQRLDPGLFPLLDIALPEKTCMHMKVIATLDTLEVEKWVDGDQGFRAVNPGRPKLERACMLRAFISKSVLKLVTTVALLDRLSVDAVLRRICGWVTTDSIPCEATFSNAFREFSDSQVLEKIHAHLVEESLKDDMVFHVSRDSTAIEGREKPKPKEKTEEKEEKIVKKRGRPAKDDIREPKEPTRLEIQQTQSLDEMIADLPKDADYGVKKGSDGFAFSWCGFKLHLDVSDGGIPISCLVTSASMHDSGASLPLQLMTDSRVKGLYILADKAYDSEIIRESIKDSGMVSIIPENRRRKAEECASSLTPCEKRRFKNRSGAERANSELKLSFGACNVWVKGHAKVSCHLMFGVLALTATALLRLR